MPGIRKISGAVAFLIGAAAAPAWADVHPYLSGGVGSSFDAVEPAIAGFAPFPLRSPGRLGPVGVRSTLGLDGGLGLDLGPDARLFGGLGLRGVAALPTQEARLGGTLASSITSALGAGFRGTVGYAYRDDFAGYRGHDAMLALEQSIGNRVSSYTDGGYEWAGTNTAGYEGPFADLGVRWPFDPLEATILADVGIARQAYLDTRQDLVGSFSLGIRKRITGGFTLWATGGPAWGMSSTVGLSYMAPAVSVGVSWMFDEAGWSAPPRPVKNPGMTTDLFPG